MSEAVRVVVADDEPVARRRIVRLLEETGGGEARVVAVCAGGRDTVRQVLALEPELLFLDVQMPDLDGFGVVAAIPEARRPAIVFVTAFDRYAIKAFDVHAVDYLLKPFDTARFAAAYRRARERARDPRQGGRAALEALLAQLAGRPAAGGEAGEGYLDRVSVGEQGALKVIRVEDVDWFEADGNYVKVQAGSAQHRLRMPLRVLEARLDPRRFMRTHRSYIVNVEHVVEVRPWLAGRAVVVLRSGRVGLSRPYRRRLRQRLGARPRA